MNKSSLFLVPTLALFSAASMAALDAGVTDALTAAKTDGVAVAGLVLGVIIAIAAFKYIRRAL